MNGCGAVGIAEIHAGAGTDDAVLRTTQFHAGHFGRNADNRLIGAVVNDFQLFQRDVMREVAMPSPLTASTGLLRPSSVSRRITRSWNRKYRPYWRHRCQGLPFTRLRPADHDRRRAGTAVQVIQR